MLLVIGKWLFKVVVKNGKKIIGALSGAPYKIKRIYR